MSVFGALRALFGSSAHKITVKQAVRTLAERITSHGAEPGEALPEQAMFVALIAVLFSLRCSKDPCWQRAGPDIFGRLTAALRDHLDADFPSDVLNGLEIIAAVNTYSLAIDMGIDDAGADVPIELGSDDAGADVPIELGSDDAGADVPIELGSDDALRRNVAHEVGVTFARSHGEEGDNDLIRKGADIFMKETDAMFRLFKEYVLVT